MTIEDGKNKEVESKELKPTIKVKVPEVPDEASDLRALIKIMAEREARLANKELEEVRKIENVKKQRESNSASILYEILHKQSNCTHLKGGKHRRNNAAKDYAIYAHTFADGSTYIKCTICSMKWFKQDSKEHLMRHGFEVPNHTGIGWREAYTMLNDSTNKPSSSEISPEVKEELMKQRLLSGEGVKDGDPSANQKAPMYKY